MMICYFQLIAITCVSKDSCQHGDPWQHPQWPMCYDKACGCSLGWFSWIPQYQTCGRNLHMPSGLVLASVAKDISYKENMSLLPCKKNQTLWPKQPSGLALVLSPPSPHLPALHLLHWEAGYSGNMQQSKQIAMIFSSPCTPKMSPLA